MKSGQCSLSFKPFRISSICSSLCFVSVPIFRGSSLLWGTCSFWCDRGFVFWWLPSEPCCRFAIGIFRTGEPDQPKFVGETRIRTPRTNWSPLREKKNQKKKACNFCASSLTCPISQSFGNLRYHIPEFPASRAHSLRFLSSDHLPHSVTGRPFSFDGGVRRLPACFDRFECPGPQWAAALVCRGQPSDPSAHA